MTIGGSFLQLMAELEQGVTRGEFGYKIHSRDLRRYVERMGGKMENMNESFEIMGEMIQKQFFQHFLNEEGPDPLTGQMKEWPAYNDPLNNQEMSYHDRKIRGDYGDFPDKMMEASGELINSIMDPNNVKASRQRMEIRTDVGHGIYGHTGFTGKKGHPTPAQTQRPIVGLTDEEEGNIIDNMLNGFWNDIEG